MGPRQGQEKIIHLAATSGLSGIESAATSLVPDAGDSLRERRHEALVAKRGIARWAAQQIRPGETIMLDTGSAVAALAHELRPAHNLTVATASLTVLQELAGAESIHVECLGHAAACQPKLRRPPRRGGVGAHHVRSRLPGRR